MSKLENFWLSAENASDHGRLAEAERLYRSALALESGHVPSLIGLSRVLSLQGAQREAYEAAMQAWAMRPEEDPVRYALAQRLGYFQEFSAMAECLAQSSLAKTAPTNIVARAAMMLSGIGAHQEAMEIIDEVLLRSPRDPACLYMKGNLSLFSGRSDEAVRFYEMALAIDGGFSQASWMLASAKTQTSDNNHVEYIRSRLSKVPAKSEAEAYLAYGLHKELHDIGDYKEAWSALERGCRAKRAGLNYSSNTDVELADAVIEVCRPEFLSEVVSVKLDARPIFIVGMHRSGTTLLEHMLSRHSEVSDSGETRAFDGCMHLAADYVSKIGYPDVELVNRSRSLSYSDVAQNYAKRLPWLARGRRFFTEKLPMNFWNVGFISKALPQARVIHMVRDPVEVCFSNLRTLFAGVAPYSYDQRELGEFYIQYRRVVDHWRRSLPGVFMDVYYSELVESPERVLRSICDFCQLEFQPLMLERSAASGYIATASAGLVRQGLHKNRGGIWRSYHSNLGPLLEVVSPFT